MKKLIAASLLASASTVAFANGPAGCGLGSTVVFPDANEWHEFVLAATTNGISGNQTFGMTSGTLGCQSANGPLKLAELFMNDNLDQLAIEAAQGQGETLSALAEVMDITEQDSAAFARLVKGNYDTIFSVDATAETAYQSLISLLSDDVELQKYAG